MKTKTPKPLANFGLIKKRILKTAATPPAAPLKGRGNVRIPIDTPLVFGHLRNLAPGHCEVIAERAPINRFGKLGYVARNYVSPELAQVIAANAGDFLKLEAAMKTVSNSNL